MNFQRPSSLKLYSGKRHVLVATAAVAFAAAASTVGASDWQYNPRVEVGVQADDNYHLTPVDKVSVVGPFTDVALQMLWLTPLTSISVTPDVHATYFPSDHPDDYVAPSVDLAVHQRGLTYDATLNGTFSKEPVVQSDRLTTAVGPGGLGNPTGGDSGFVNIRNKRELSQVVPAVTYDFTPRRRLEISGMFMDTRYDKLVLGSYVPFTDSEGMLALSQDVSPKDTLTLRGTFAHFDPHEKSNTSNTVGEEFEWLRHLTPIQQAYLRVGSARSTFGPPPAAIGGIQPT